jgi:hypothetical protein
MNREYQIYRNIAYYMRLKYPEVLYHFDPTGLNLSKTQSGQLKAIQGGRGYPDLFIIEPRNGYHGLFIEIKAEGNNPIRKDGTVREGCYEYDQILFLDALNKKGFQAVMAVGFDACMKVIDQYLR